MSDPRAGRRGDRRRRFAKACDACRQRKLRCDGIRPRCTRCGHIETACTYSDLAKPSTHSRQTKTAGPRTLNPLQDSSSVSQHDIATTSRLSPPSKPQDLEPPPSLGAEPPQGQNVQSLRNVRVTSSGQETTLPATDPSIHDTVFGGAGDTRYFGPSSGISLVSDDAKYGEGQPSAQSGERWPIDQGSWSIWTHSSIQSVFERRTYQPLPTWREALSLVNDYFDHEQKAFPCFHPPTFMGLLAQQYSEGTCGSPAGWASLNAVLAIAQRGRVERGLCLSEDKNLAWGYAANALGSVLEILMCNTQLLSVQALLSIAWFFIGTPNPQPSFVLTASAVRLAHSIGLHKCDKFSSRNLVEHMTKNRVFWIALGLDRDICLRTGRPPAQDFYDYRVNHLEDLTEEICETILVVNGSALNVFSAATELTLLQGHIYQKLYSGQETAASKNDAQDQVQPLDNRLTDWRANFAPSLDPTQCSQGIEHPAVLRLYYSYYNCVIAIHRAKGSEYWMPLKIPTISEPSIGAATSIQRCLEAARSVTALLGLIPGKWQTLSWEVLSVHVSAVIILCAHILRQPSSTTVRHDMDAVSTILRHVTALEAGYRETYIHNVRLICEKLFRMAQAVSRGYEYDQPSSLPGQQMRYETPVDKARQQISSDLSTWNSGLPVTANPLAPLTPQEIEQTTVEAGMSRFDFQNGWIHQPRKPSGDLLSAQWSFDVLLGGFPIPEAGSQGYYNYS